MWKSSPERYLMLRYEDFVEKPQEAVKHMLDFIHEDPKKLPFVGENKVELGINHGVWGNPSRFQSGVVELKQDSEWKTKMKTIDKLFSTFLTWPLLLKYHY